MNFKSLMIVSTVVLFGMAGCSKPLAPATKTNDNAKQAQGNAKKETRRKAEAGVGKKGQKIKNHHGPLATPAKALFKAEQQIMFMKIDQALQAFEIMNDRYPKSHDEYMEKVIKANHLTLPELPAGQRYEFDTQTNELMVIGSGGEEGE